MTANATERQKIEETTPKNEYSLIQKSDNAKEIDKAIKEDNMTDEMAARYISDEDKFDIEKTFEEVNDFNELWKRITAPINNVVEKSAKIIEKDPIMDVNDTLEKANEDMSKVYKEIINNDSMLGTILKSIPVVWNIYTKFQEKSENIKFKISWISNQIKIIFSWFKQSRESLGKSIEMQREFLKWIEDNINKIKAYRYFLNKKLNEFRNKYLKSASKEDKEKFELFMRNVEYFIMNLNTLIWNLDLARKRLMMRIDTAIKLEMTMDSSEPIFKTLFSIAVLETSGQKAIDASMKTMKAMWSTIDKMSSDLTNKAIESSRKAEEMASKPVLDTNIFIENVKKLKNHFDTIEEYRKQVRTKAAEEKKAFEEATKTLEKIKPGKANDYDEFKKEIWMAKNK